MPIKIASHLQKSRHGIYYFRHRIPAKFQKKFGKKEIVLSLGTSSLAEAKMSSLQLSYQFSQMTKPRTGQYKIDLEKGIAEATDATDHGQMMEALKEMRIIAEMRDKIQTQIEQSPGYSNQQPSRTARLSEAAKEYLPTLQNAKTRSAFEKSINLFVEFGGNVFTHNITSLQILEFNKNMRQTVAARTADNRLQALQCLFKWCVKNEYIHQSATIPTAGKFNLTKKQRNQQTKGADAFSVEQLIQIFEPNQYEKYTRIYNKRTSLARHWMPLIALHSGMRLEEVAQLRKNEIQENNNIIYFDLTKREQLKTDAAARLIPVHETLLRLCFMDFVKSAGAQNATLFPECKNSGSGVSSSFRRHLEAIGVRKKGVERRTVFHSLRDTFNNTLEKNGVPAGVRFALMGHSDGSTNSQSYTSPSTLERLQLEGVNQLIFKEKIGGEEYELKL